jgi:hypothetical protein
MTNNSIIEPVLGGGVEGPIEYTSNYLTDKTIINLSPEATATNNSDTIDMQFLCENEAGIELVISKFVDNVAIQLPDIIMEIDYAFYGAYTITGAWYDDEGERVEFLRLPLASDFEFYVITEPFPDNITDSSALVTESSQYKISGNLNTQMRNVTSNANSFNINSFGRMILEPDGAGYGMLIKRSPAPTPPYRFREFEHDLIRFKNIVDV